MQTYPKNPKLHTALYPHQPLLKACLLLSLLCLYAFNTQDLLLQGYKSKLQEETPTTYSAIDELLKPIKKDTIAINNILEGMDHTQQAATVSYLLNQKGTVYRNLSSFNTALTLHEKALEIAKQAKLQEFEVYSLNMIGVVYRRMDAIKTALDYNQKALELAESITAPTKHIKRNINISLNGIGNLYQTLGQYDLAITHFKKAIALETELNNTLGLAINNQNIGHCLELKGDLDGAIAQYQKSLALNEEIRNQYGKVICKNTIAQVYLKQGMPNKAIALLKQLMGPIEEIKDKKIWSSILINTGWGEMDIKNYAAAEKYMKEGLNMAVANNMPSQIIYAKKLLSDLAAAQGNHKAALTHYKEAEALDNELKDDRNLRYINDLILRYEAEKRDNEIFKLANENELVKVRLRRNSTSILAGTLVIGLISTILFIMYRQRQSNYEKKVLGLEQNLLRSQMNPHFLFNSLNSIKLYIINNDKKKAVHYLNKFSKLVRRILNGSTLKETSLAEELETAKLYLNIENIRFSEALDYQINIDPEIDPDHIKIPSLVLQPFLENAIWHGLSAKAGSKKLWLNINKKDDMHVLVSIVDNGVGRAASAKIKEQRVLKRQSVGIDITKERLANFAKDYQYGFEVAIIDLYDDQGQPKGTKVALEIPTV